MNTTLYEKVKDCMLYPERAAYPPAGDPAWQQLSPETIGEICQLDALYHNQPWPMRRATDFLAFVRDGSRKADETPYFARRRKLCAAAIACCTGLDRLDDVTDGVWCLCEESSWVISAHNHNAIPGALNPAEQPLPDPDNPYVDLFSAQTAMILAITCQILGTQLDGVTPQLRRRAEKEIRKRVLVPFLTRDDFWWMGLIRKDLNNWTPWIVSNVLVAGCLSPLAAEETRLLVRRACAMLDRYLAVIPADGGCDEGPGYWNMAGGALLDCLELLEKITDGQLACWQDQKIRNLMRFPLVTEISPGWFANFADCDARAYLSGERLQLAGEKLHDPALVALGLRYRGTLNDQLKDVPHLTRLMSLLFHSPVASPPGAVPEDAWLPDLQWRVVRRGRLALCCKGGHNGENHNHNDTGSFMAYVDGEPLLVDAGNMTYTAKTFSAERYTLWHTRSAFHNLPLIGETEQGAGNQFAATEVSCLADGLDLRLDQAYPAEAKLRVFRRRMQLTETGLTVTDSLTMAEPRPVTWVFLCRVQPEVNFGQVQIGPMKLSLPPELQVRREEIKITDPRMARNFPGSLWRLMLTAPAANQLDLQFVFTLLP